MNLSQMQILPLLVTVILNFPPLPSFTELHSRLLSFESQTCRVSTDSHTPITALFSSQTPHAPPYNHAFRSASRGSYRGNRNGRFNNRGSWSSRGRGSWNSSPSPWTAPPGRGAYDCPLWAPSQAGLLGVSPPWCPTCSTNQHIIAACPHRFASPDSFSSPFASSQVVQYQYPNRYPDTGATHHMTGNVAAF